VTTDPSAGQPRRVREIPATPTRPVPVRPQPDPGSGVATQLAGATRVYLHQSAGGWSRVRLLDGPGAGVEGWVDANAVIRGPHGTANSPTELAQLFQVLRGARFTAPNGFSAPIPFHYPVDGCFARAQVMADLLDAAGYTVDKEFVVAKKGLRVDTPYGADQDELGGPLHVNWWYHVAPVVYLRDRPIPEKPSPYVLDPSVSTGPLTVAGWIATMTSDPFTEMTYEELRVRLQAGNAYSPDQTWAARSGRVVYQPPFAADPRATITATPAQAAADLVGPAVREPAHDVVADLNRLFRACLASWNADQAKRDDPVPYAGYAGDLAGVLAKINALHPLQRGYIAGSFGTFLKDWTNTVVGSGIAPQVAHVWQRLST
jgi:Glutaminase